jgi:hypothetical protein
LGLSAIVPEDKGERLDAGFRGEFYVKTGIVLLAATVPFSLIILAGPIAILQASIVSIVILLVMFWVGVKLGLDWRLAATLGAGGAVCGVSAAIAVAGAVGAKKEDAPIAITAVILWAIVMIFALPIVGRALHLPTGVAGAWIGTSEFADAAGIAAAQAYGGFAGKIDGIAGTSEQAIQAFTLMKVVGRDVWIGIWASVLAIIATTRWEARPAGSAPDAGEISRRFPNSCSDSLHPGITRQKNALRRPGRESCNPVSGNMILQPWQLGRSVVGASAATLISRPWCVHSPSSRWEKGWAGQQAFRSPRLTVAWRWAPARRATCHGESR